jgi:hypothetical protein
MELRIVVAVLAVWKVCQVLAYEDGPWDLMIWLRRHLHPGQGRDPLKIRSMLSQGLNCVACSSVWIAWLPAWWIASGWKEWAVLWLAIAGAATILDHLEYFYYRSR